MTVFTFLTFPRSGSNFLLENLTKATGYDGRKMRQTHLFDKVDESTVVVGIIKDPVLSLTSWLTMMEHYSMNMNGLVEKTIQWYLDVYKYYETNDCVLIRASELQQYPHKTLKLLADTIGMEYSKSELIDISDKPNKKYLATSTDSAQKYSKWKATFENMDLSECYRLYEVALSKSISTIQ